MKKRFFVKEDGCAQSSFEKWVVVDDLDNLVARVTYQNRARQIVRLLNGASK